MMGPMKPGEIRARLREQSGLSKTEIAALVDKQLAEADEALAESLRLFRDALLKETKRKVRRTVKRQVSKTASGDRS